MPGLFFVGGYPRTARNASYIYLVVGIKTLLPADARPACVGLVFYGVRFKCT